MMEGMVNSPSSFDDGSSRHHFIPKYYLSGFVGEDGFFVRYDKEKGTIRRERFRPRQVYWRDDGNTALFHGKRVTLGEKVFALMDQEIAKELKRIRSLLSMEESEIPYFATIALNAAFLQHLRGPDAELLYRGFLAGSEGGIEIFDKRGERMRSVENEFKTEDLYHKVMRAFLPTHLLNEAMQKNQARYTSKQPAFRKWSHPVLVLGDVPVVFPRRVLCPEDMLQDMMFPISSDFLFAYSGNGRFKEGAAPWKNYNALAIEQATEFVCAPNERLLSSAVKDWEDFKQRGYLPGRRELVFSGSFIAPAS